MPIDLPEVAVFASGRYATAWDAEGRPIEWSDWTDDDLRLMAENDARLRETGQPEPYIKPSHDAEPVPGRVGPLRYSSGKLYASIIRCADWLAEQILGGVRPWRSAEILRHAEAANYKGVSGPVFKGLALLNTHPRVKTLDSAVYGDARFEEPAAVAGSSLVTFEEGAAMQLTAEQTLAALKALGGDQKLLEKLLAAITEGDASGGGGDGDGAAPPAMEAGEGGDAPPVSEEEKKKEEEAAMQASDAAAQIARLKADQALLRQQLDEQRAQRAADIALARTDKLVRFADSVSHTHGRAVADKAKAAAEARFKGLPATENFADGRDLVDEVFAEIRGLLGPATRKTAPIAAQQGGGTSTVSEEFSEERAREEIFADKHPLEVIHLQSKAGKPLLDKLIADRKAAAEKGV